jgi:hypothetical protein
MDFQMKLFTWEDKGKHLIIIARGCVDIAAFDRLFLEIAAATQMLEECKILVELTDGGLKLATAEIEAWADNFPANFWPPGNIVALVSGAAIEDFYQLFLLRVALAARGFKTAAFRDSKAAIDWLTQTACGRR